MIINFSPVSKRLEDGVNLGPGLLKKQHIKMFQVYNFVLSKKKIVMKRFVLNIALLKKCFTSNCLENQQWNNATKSIPRGGKEILLINYKVLVLRYLETLVL